MDQVHVIRHKVLVEGLSIRRVAREMRVIRNTVRKYLKVPEPQRQESEARPRPEQQITGTRLHRELVEEGSPHVTPSRFSDTICPTSGHRRRLLK